jgi:hypothetical protein
MKIVQSLKVIGKPAISYLEGSGWAVGAMTKERGVFFLCKDCTWREEDLFYFKTEYSAKVTLATYRFGKPAIHFQEGCGWRVYGNGYRYLHMDGEWRSSAFFCNELSGYFPSKKVAKNAFANCSILESN